MRISRRDSLKLLATTAATSIVGPSLISVAPAQEGPARLPLEEFIQDETLMNSLRRGVAAMQRRAPSNPTSWFYQAAIHGVTEATVAAALEMDPLIAQVDQEKYWNRCPHFGQNSADFLPWHRAYTYYFERILRAASGNTQFALPYWNYIDEEQRLFPSAYGVATVDPQGLIPNPLWFFNRDKTFADYGWRNIGTATEPVFELVAPRFQLSASAVDISTTMSQEVFFGDLESQGFGGGIGDENANTKGWIERRPHDQIHVAVGGIVGSVNGAMAVVRTAGFDPVFSVHHCNMDRLWLEWACSPGKSWGRLPPKSWFDERPWFFFNENGQEQNEPRSKFFDLEGLGVRFAHPPADPPLTLPEMTDGPVIAVAATTRSRETLLREPIGLEIDPAVEQTSIAVPSLGAAAVAARQRSAAAGAATNESYVLRLVDISVHASPTVSLDVYLTGAEDVVDPEQKKGYVGTIALFGMSHHGGSATQEFDATKVLNEIGDLTTGVKVTILSRSLYEPVDGGPAALINQPVIEIGAIELQRIALQPSQ